MSKKFLTRGAVGLIVLLTPITALADMIGSNSGSNGNSAQASITKGVSGAINFKE